MFRTGQQRVLALLFGQPSRSFYASELIALTGSGSGAGRWTRTGTRSSPGR